MYKNKAYIFNPVMSEISLHPETLKEIPNLEPCLFSEIPVENVLIFNNICYVKSEVMIIEENILRECLSII